MRVLTFIHATGFDDDWSELGLTDEDLRVIQQMIQENPTGPPVVKGTGGLRKMRFAPPKKRGRRNWFRVCYVYFPVAATVLLVVAYAKNELDDLSPADKKFIRSMIEREHEALSRRAAQ